MLVFCGSYVAITHGTGTVCWSAVCDGGIS